MRRQRGKQARAAKTYWEQHQGIGQLTEPGRYPIPRTLLPTSRTSATNKCYLPQWFPTHARVRYAVAEYIEVFYNRKRHHSTLDYRTPWQTWTDYRAARPAA